MKLGRFLTRKLKENLIRVSSPDDISVDFADLYGVEHAIEVLQDIPTYFKNPSSDIQPHRTYLIFGDVGTGKASLGYGAAKASKIPVIDFEASIFSTLTSDKEVNKKFDLILTATKKLCDEYDGCIILFRNAEELEESENVYAFYHNLIKSFSTMPNVFIFALSSTCSVSFPLIVKENNFFSTTIGIEYPNLAIREKLLETFIKKEKIKLDDNVSINRLAKETFGETPARIAYIVKEAYLFSKRQKHETVTHNDFSETIMKLSAGEKSFKMSDKERKIIAYHEAGHVIAGYFSNPEYNLSRVEISPRYESLGLTVPEINEDKLYYTREDYERFIIHSLGGLAAEEVVYGAHGSSVSVDLQHATAYAINIINAFGMHEDFGIMVVISGLTDSPTTRALSEKLIKELLVKLREKTLKIMEEKRPYLEALTEALVEKEVVLGSEIEKIFKKVASEIGDAELKFNVSTSEK